MRTYSKREEALIKKEKKKKGTRKREKAQKDVANSKLYEVPWAPF